MNEKSYSYNEIHTMVEELAPRIQTDCILAIGKGGIIPGAMLSQILNIPFEILNYSSKNGKGGKLNCELYKIPILFHDRILIVDEICDSGHTLKEVFDFYECHNEVQTLALFYKKTSMFEPDYYHTTINDNDGWIHFPWEPK